MQQILEGKCRRRRALAALSYPEKVRIVEQMRETMTRIRASAPSAKKIVAFPKL